MTAKPAEKREGEALPADTASRLLDEFAGDAHAAVTALLQEVSRLEYELAVTKPAVSRGFSRGWHHKRWTGDGHP